jgi:hypothetical protein
MVDATQPDSIIEAYARNRKALKVAIETLAVVKVELYFHDIHLTSATAFVYRFAKTYALVTSLHVLNGFNSNTQKYLDSRNFVPNKIAFYLNVFTRSGNFGLSRSASISYEMDNPSGSNRR